MIRPIVFSSLLAAGLGGGLGAAAAAAPAPPGAALYEAHCAACHGADRLGGTGPALIPESLRYLRGDKLAAVITQGRASTQMPAFADVLAGEEIGALVDFISVPLAEVPVWAAEQIDASREFNADYRQAAAPLFDADCSQRRVFAVISRSYWV